MSRDIMNNDLFRKLPVFRAPPPKVMPATRADLTDTTARAIIAADTASREASTARLRQLRLERDALRALEPAPEAPVKAARARKPKAS